MTTAFWQGLGLIVGINAAALVALVSFDYVLRLRMTNEQLRDALNYAVKK